MPEKQLYSNIQKERLEAAEETKGHSVITTITDIKKFYWFGAANAWLVFLGISPGNSSPKGKKNETDFRSQVSFNEVSDHLLNFEDTNTFWVKIREYTKEFFPNVDQEDLYRMILTGNLIEKQEGDSSKIINADTEKKLLRQGATESFKVLSLVKPKVVICLQKEVYELMFELAKANNHSKVQQDRILEVDSKLNTKSTRTAPIYKVPVTFLESPDELWNRWVVTRVPMHPSRANFCNQENFKNQFLIALKSLVNEFIER